MSKLQRNRKTEFFKPLIFPSPVFHSGKTA